MKLSQRNGRCGRSRSIHIIRAIKLPVIGMGGVGKIFGRQHSKLCQRSQGNTHRSPPGWSNHFVSKRKYHVIIPKCYLKDDVFDIQNHLFHGFGCFPLMGLKVFHGFGCSALMGLKVFHGFGCSALMGLKVFHGFGCSALMGLKVFHGFGCSALMGLKGVVSIFVEEKSWTSGTEFVQFFRSKLPYWLSFFVFVNINKC
ncbi:uncharacterized protein LOC116116630 isoform X2 [Pistacia vera]|uniref:uncharacterized protein LOC116116630 isoform X2 n=1 Tax=Pistacia vera TaxID=55513 RepID=UPI0012636050|nr:uncharacterized protein LOC116116630 isoform X2 [Pistacia vera]